MNYRTAIRNRVRDILLDRTLAGRDVVSGFVVPADPKPEPQICVYIGRMFRGQEDVGSLFIGELSLVIEAIVGGANAEDLETVCEDLEDQVRAILDVDHTLGNAAIDSKFSTSQIDILGNSPFVGALLLEYKVRLWVETLGYADRIATPGGLPMPDSATAEITGGPR